MAGSPKRRARKLATLAAERAQQRGISIDEAMNQLEAEQESRVVTSGPPAQPTSSGQLPPGEEHRLKLEAARDAIRKGQAEWLIGAPDEIAEAFEARSETDRKYTPELAAKLVYLTRCGIPVRDSAFGPGAASQCGVSAVAVWQWTHSKPEFGRAMQEARDASSHILEDEMRAMLPSAIARPDLLKSLEFVAGRLEWLAKARNPDRYGAKKDAGPSQSITFNIMGSKPEPKDVTPATLENQAAPHAPRAIGLSLAKQTVRTEGEGE